MEKYLFLPGCSLRRGGPSSLEALQTIREVLGLEMEALEGWNCCGADDYGAIQQAGAVALQSRNLALAGRQGADECTLATACSTCYLNMARTELALRNDARLASQINRVLEAGGLHYTPGSVRVRHLLDIFMQDYGTAEIERRVVRPLAGLRVAAYYGCGLEGAANQRLGLEDLVTALGAEVVDFPARAQCCGGHTAQAGAPEVREQVREIIAGAADSQANLVTTLCPECRLNLDTYQSGRRMPVVFFIELVALAFGKDPRGSGMHPALGAWHAVQAAVK
jgi:heterodisulfide reductase subunit B